MKTHTCVSLLLLPLLASRVLAASPLSQLTVAKLAVNPPSLSLNGRDDHWQILVDAQTQDGQFFDTTRRAKFRSLTPKVAQVTSRGVVQPISDGKATIEITAAGKRTELPVEVQNAALARPLNFEDDILPILGRFGCNASGCHGKAEGQNGFKLSVFGFDPPADYQALVMEGRGRRVFPGAAEQSLLLQKASGQTPHGGGVRIDVDWPEYRVLRDWVAAGLPLGGEDDPKVAKVEISPNQRRLAMDQWQQLRVVATWSDGRQRDVTRLAQFQSNNDALAAVDGDGLVIAGQALGSVAVMATFMGNVDVFQAFVPRGEEIANYPPLAENNFIDRFVHQKLRKLNILPSPPGSDADFLRRVYLDILGTLPTAAESRAFLTDDRSDKRSRLVDQLLKRPEYADYWSLKWADLLRVNRRQLGHKGAYAYHRWIRDSFSANKPLDQFAREIIAAEGPLRDAPGGQFFRVVGEPRMMANTLSQVFLGVRIECAQCHHHPFDRWSQTDYYGMQAYFTQVAFKDSPRGSVLLSSADRPTNHPRTGAAIYAHALATPMPAKSPAGDRRKLLAAWMTSPDNPWFARNIANRAWAHFMGRGLVEPVDDVRLTNPPSNPELLDALAESFVADKYDYQALIRTITASQAYQRSPQPNATNAEDEQNYSRFLFKQLEAEVLFDAICQTTGVGEKFQGVPAGSRAIQLWDSEVPHYFLTLFGRPMRVTACQCERVSEPTVGQVLHMLNSPEIHAKISHAGGRVAGLTRQYTDDEPLVEELYLTFFNRFPSPQERATAQQYLKLRADRRKAVEDLAWTMLNSLEVLFNH